MRLTKAEEQVMHILWDLKEGAVSDIRSRFGDPKPARNTVSTVLRILEKKGFASHKTYGNVHVFFSVVSKNEYSKSQLSGLLKDYFNNSFPVMATFFARENDLSATELEKILKEIRKEMSGNRKQE